ncbi:hypothetical protein LQW54_012598 [Pestalotiopsis sp. IQ-011]
MSYTRSVLITGGTINLGYYAALEIAREHPDWLVVIGSRSDKEHAAESINKTLQQNNVFFLHLDLSESENVRTFAENWIAKGYPPIQALLLNAALQFPDKMVLTAEGIEATYAISHVGHALLFHLLCPYLAQNAHVVVTASGVHDPAQKSGLPDAIYTTAEELAHPPPAMAKRPGTGHYTNTKLANFLWTYVLNRRLSQNVPDRGIKTGVMRFAWFKIFPRITPLLRVVFTANIHKPSESGASLAHVADNAANVSGKYFEGRKEIQSSQQTYDEKKQDDLWQWTIKHCVENEE